MFNFFRKKPTLPPHRNLVWLNTGAKLRGLQQLIQQHPDCAVLAWFPRTQQDTQAELSKAGIELEIKLCRNATSFNSNGKTVFMLEHYPLFEKEKQLFDSITPAQLIFLNALDEPFFQKNGGERIQQMMVSLGMEENESIEHKLISSSIQNIQEKLQKKITVDHSAQSQEEWFNKAQS